MTAAQYNFTLLNSRYFHNRLKNVTVRWSKSLPKGTLGRTQSVSGRVTEGERKFLIELDLKSRRYGSLMRMTLLHEMVHVEQWEKVTSRSCHGHRFQRRMKQLAQKGAFNGLW